MTPLFTGRLSFRPARLIALMPLLFIHLRPPIAAEGKPIVRRQQDVEAGHHAYREGLSEGDVRSMDVMENGQMHVVRERVGESEQDRALKSIKSNAERNGKSSEWHVKTFELKVTGPDGTEVCLSELEPNGRRERPLGPAKCIGSPSQKFYWEGSQVKTLMSRKRCLGYEKYPAGYSLRQLSMHPCSDLLHAGWQVNEEGLLQTSDSEHCMEFHPEQQFAHAAPCKMDE